MTRSVTRMTIEDAGHYTPAQRAAIIASYPEHEREARTKGVPQLGSGRVFLTSEDDVICEARQEGTHPIWWRALGALDFGWDHPTAAVKLLHDTETDTVYVTTTHRLRQATPLTHVEALKPWGDWLPWTWPHDGLQHDKGSGEQLAAQYRKLGLKMLPERATFTDGTSGLEAGVAMMATRLETGRLKVYAHLREWLDEYRLYHRKDGVIVKEYDDLLSATRYGLMMLRHAKTVPPKQGAHRADLRQRTSWVA